MIPNKSEATRALQTTIPAVPDEGSVMQSSRWQDYLRRLRLHQPHSLPVRAESYGLQVVSLSPGRRWQDVAIMASRRAPRL